jgi:DNA-binding winged helix-turn-helix (wHTH) protein
MVMGTPVKQLYEFGAFQLDPPERLLLCDGQPVPMPPRAFDLLVFLVERRGHLIEKDELLREVWHGSFVEEGNLSVTVSVLRKALNDDRGQHKYIETVSKRGYRFVRFVKVVSWRRLWLRRNPKILRDRSRRAQKNSRWRFPSPPALFSEAFSGA